MKAPRAAGGPLSWPPRGADDVTNGRAFVSRGGIKLDAAMGVFGIDVSGVRALDAGAAAGGFTDCILRRGAREVVAVDVAYGQLDWGLRNDPRVIVRERTNVRLLDQAGAGGPVDLVVADLSFISLLTVADALLAVCTPQANLVLMVKPQFELPRAQVPRGGVVRDPDGWRNAVRHVAEGYGARGCALRGATASPITGPKGNREFFVHLSRAGTRPADGWATDAYAALIDAAIEGAP